MITHLTDIRERALARVPSKLRSDPVFAAFIAGLAAGVQALEDDAWELLALTVDNAVGAQLEQIGAWVGEDPAGDLTDAEYRRFILARIQINKSNGTVEDAIAILSAIAGVTATQKNYVPATSALTIVTDPLLSAAVRARLVTSMGACKPAGVRRTISEAPVGYFGFVGNPDALGFGAGQLADFVE